MMKIGMNMALCEQTHVSAQGHAFLLRDTHLLTVHCPLSPDSERVEMVNTFCHQFLMDSWSTLGPNQTASKNLQRE